jgi:hypothetical protein
LRMNLTHRSVSQETNLVPFPGTQVEPHAASAQGDD